ncbi:hypothetical protein [Clostridium grantii]|uniref:Uncharacterized protein n=1 Tax=Clostridium grantii DSM 8605 TaxID=1121316 RepID=A0A1M5WZ70_9CLOT|nr:hypothetical protein [Clostridium grantii]SHH92919.1 hypothetical protein SAMN02745207_03220 [Clostridium grantii DSM 8605]
MKSIFSNNFNDYIVLLFKLATIRGAYHLIKYEKGYAKFVTQLPKQIK